MLRRGLVLAAFLAVAALCWFQSRQLPLSFFVLTPALLFPVLYFFNEEDRTSFYGTGAVLILLYAAHWMSARDLESSMFGAELVGAFALLTLYRSRWVREAAAVHWERQRILEELDDLRGRHRSRIESLRHLEKQVGGLLDLFEIARDFNECLSFQSMAGILYQEVLPKLEFEKLWLIRQRRDTEGEVHSEGLLVHRKGVDAADGAFVEEVLREFSAAGNPETMRQKGKEWRFPLATEQDMKAALVVLGTHEEDLAKFEVLAAYLSLQVKKIKLYETVRELSIRDQLTGFFVRRHFLERFSGELSRSIDHHLPLSVLMLDIDHFKRYNDAHGHLVGDRTLKQVARLFRDCLRKVDLVARYGGEEFAIVIPECEREGALEVAERIRSGIERHPFKIHPAETQVTVSIGVTLFSQRDSRRLARADLMGLALQLIQEADQALYRAKAEGRNRVVLYGP